MAEHVILEVPIDEVRVGDEFCCSLIHPEWIRVEEVSHARSRADNSPLIYYLYVVVEGEVRPWYAIKADRSVIARRAVSSEGSGGEADARCKCTGPRLRLAWCNSCGLRYPPSFSNEALTGLSPAGFRRARAAAEAWARFPRAGISLRKEVDRGVDQS